MKIKLSLLVLVFVFCEAQSVENEQIPQSLLEQVEQGNAEAAYFIATMFDKGSELINKNPKKAKKWMLKAAEMNLPQAMYELALILEFDNEEYEEAMKWYLKASEFGHAAAMGNLAYMNMKGLGSLQQNCQTAYQWYEKAIAKDEEVAFNDYIWSLATHENKKCRNAEKALYYYSKFMTVLNTDYQQMPAYVLDTGAAVFAAVSDFNQAIKLQTMALDKLVDKDKTSAYQERLNTYQSRQAWTQKQ